MGITIMQTPDLPAPLANPALEQRRRLGSSIEMVPDDVLRRFSFGVPDESALERIATAAAGQVIELGAGTGYWARLLAERDVDIVAFDRYPPPSAQNNWFAGVRPWYPVRIGDERVLNGFAHRALLLVWPTKDEVWPAEALRHYYLAGGQVVAYVGEPPGGRTGDDAFHALLGQYDRCWSCAYGAAAVCLCDIQPLWRQFDECSLPSWPGFVDRLFIYRARRQPAPPLSPHPRRRGWWGTGRRGRPR